MAGPLHVGHAEFGVAGAIVREATVAFCREHPEVRLSVHGAGLVHQEAEVRAGRLDVGFCFAADPDDPTFATDVLSEDVLTGVLLPAAHPLAGRDALTIPALRELPFVIVPRRLATRMHDALLERLRDLGLASAVRQDIENAGSLFAVIAAGTAWAAAPETLREHLPPGIVYRPVEGLRFSVVNRTLWRRGGASPALLAFVATIARVRDERCAELGGGP
jgi:DNA-binding transcriptional LysR family regulator